MERDKKCRAALYIGLTNVAKAGRRVRYRGTRGISGRAIAAVSTAVETIWGGLVERLVMAGNVHFSPTLIASWREWQLHMRFAGINARPVVRLSLFNGAVVVCQRHRVMGVTLPRARLRETPSTRNSTAKELENWIGPV